MSLLLLDTCALVWWMADEPALSATARRAIQNPDNVVLVSVASLWEIAIKTRKGRLIGTQDYLARYRELHEEWGFSTVLIEAEDAIAAGTLAIPHDDPFDRILIVQSRRLDATILTCDKAIQSHADACLW